MTPTLTDNIQEALWQEQEARNALALGLRDVITKQELVQTIRFIMRKPGGKLPTRTNRRSPAVKDRYHQDAELARAGV